MAVVVAVVRLGLKSLADVAAVWYDKQRVAAAKEHVWQRESRAMEAAERIAAGFANAGLMARMYGRQSDSLGKKRQNAGRRC